MNSFTPKFKKIYRLIFIISCNHKVQVTSLYCLSLAWIAVSDIADITDITDIAMCWWSVSASAGPSVSLQSSRSRLPAGNTSSSTHQCPSDLQYVSSYHRESWAHAHRFILVSEELILTSAWHWAPFCRLLLFVYQLVFSPTRFFSVAHSVTCARVAVAQGLLYHSTVHHQLLLLQLRIYW